MTELGFRLRYICYPESRGTDLLAALVPSHPPPKLTSLSSLLTNTLKPQSPSLCALNSQAHRVFSPPNALPRTCWLRMLPIPEV